jgi:putative redox protein
MKATINLDHGMTFHGSANSGYTLRMDSGPSVGGDDSGFRPMELLLIGLGGCTAMDVLSILRKKRQDVTGFDVNVDARQAKDRPYIFTHITVNYIVRGHEINPMAVERAIHLSVTKYCPAQTMLAKAATIEHTYEIIEEE